LADPSAGDVLKWNSPIRIRHVLYGMYLKVMFSASYLEAKGLKYTSDGKVKEVGQFANLVKEKARRRGNRLIEILKEKDTNKRDYEISLIDDYSDPHTVFELVQVASHQDTEYIPQNSLFRIRHTTTNSYLKTEESSTLTTA
jgi:hypothetical protein